MLMKKKILKSIAHSNKIPLNIRKFSEMEKSIYIDIPNTEEGTRVTLSEEVGDMAVLIPYLQGSLFRHCCQV